MEPTDFDEANITWGPPKDDSLPECVPLRGYRMKIDGRDVTISCWRSATFKERLRFLMTGTMWLYTWGHQVPVSLDTSNPFVEVEEVIPSGDFE